MLTPDFFLPVFQAPVSYNAFISEPCSLIFLYSFANENFLCDPGMILFLLKDVQFLIACSLMKASWKKSKKHETEHFLPIDLFRTTLPPSLLLFLFFILRSRGRNLQRCTNKNLMRHPQNTQFLTYFRLFLLFSPFLVGIILLVAETNIWTTGTQEHFEKCARVRR